jgi:acyl carrier protein
MSAKLERLRTWIAELHDGPVVIDDDADLIDTGLLTSLQFIQMVMVVERINESRLKPDVITIETMRTLRSIEDSVFQVLAE